MGKIKYLVDRYYAPTVCLLLFILLTLGFVGAAKPKMHKIKVYEAYKNSSIEEDKFAAIELNRCIDDGSNNADCRIKIALLAEQIKGESFKQKVAESLAKITSELDKKD